MVYFWQCLIVIIWHGQQTNGPACKFDVVINHPPKYNKADHKIAESKIYPIHKMPPREQQRSEVFSAVGQRVATIGVTNSPVPPRCPGWFHFFQHRVRSTLRIRASRRRRRRVDVRGTGGSVSPQVAPQRPPSMSLSGRRSGAAPYHHQRWRSSRRSDWILYRHNH